MKNTIKSIARRLALLIFMYGVCAVPNLFFIFVPHGPHPNISMLDEVSFLLKTLLGGGVYMLLFDHGILENNGVCLAILYIIAVVVCSILWLAHPRRWTAIFLCLVMITTGVLPVTFGLLPRALSILFR